MKTELFATLSAMHDELQSSRLDVQLAPAPDPRHQGHFIRVVCERNCDWYREFCARFPSSRRGVRVRTAIRRHTTLAALDAMLADQSAGEVYGPRLLDAARTYWKRNRADLRARLAAEMETAA